MSAPIASLGRLPILSTLAFSVGPLLAPICCTAETREIVYETLPSLLSSGVEAFEAGDFSAASDHFTRIQNSYADEPLWADSDLPIRILPLSGLASLRSQRYAESLAAFDLFLDHHAQSTEQSNFILYLKAQALQQMDASEDALLAYQDFKDASKSRDERAIANLAMANILHATPNPSRLSNS
ncbi:MAG: hypothetical protein F6K21_17220 [Symploca sp. SIO2D2]|nr:hypothetical protein [Symploca sp. SIO2D2]